MTTCHTRLAAESDGSLANLRSCVDSPKQAEQLQQVGLQLHCDRLCLLWLSLFLGGQILPEESLLLGHIGGQLGEVLQDLSAWHCMPAELPWQPVLHAGSD